MWYEVEVPFLFLVDGKFFQQTVSSHQRLFFPLLNCLQFRSVTQPCPTLRDSMHCSVASCWQSVDHKCVNTWASSGPSGKNPLANSGDRRDTASIPGWGRSPREGNGNPPRYSCLENSMDRGAWWATVHGVAQSQAWLKWLSMQHTRVSVFLDSQLYSFDLCVCSYAKTIQSWL